MQTGCAAQSSFYLFSARYRTLPPRLARTDLNPQIAKGTQSYAAAMPAPVPIRRPPMAQARPTSAGLTSLVLLGLLLQLGPGSCSLPAAAAAGVQR